MIFVNILLFLITLPLRLIGTVLGGVLYITGRLITFVNDAVGVVFRAIGIIIILFFLLGILMCAFNFREMGELSNWQFYAFAGLGLGILLFSAAQFGDRIGEHLEDWGYDLLHFSWRMISL